MNSRDQLHKYWTNPPEENDPVRYVVKKSSPFLVNVFEAHVKKESTIFEVGCNVGRNLNALFQAGYKNIGGVDINHSAIELMPHVYPEMSKSAFVTASALEDFIFQSYDVIFSMAVLCHIHPESWEVFGKMVDSAKMIITFEDEHGDGTRHKARNYENVFYTYGFNQIAYYPEIDGMNKNYHCRVMEKI